MTVKITKDKINVREKLSELDKPSGIAGEAMLRADTPAEQFELINAGRKNLLINGNFDVWQRGTTEALNAGTSGNLEYGYLADRWVTDARGADCTVSRQAFTPGQKDVPNARYFSRHTVSNITDAAGYYVHFDQRVEDLRRFDGEDVVLSFYAKASTPTLIGFEFTSRVSLVPGVEYTATDHAPYRKGDIPLNTQWKKYYIKVKTKDLTGETLLDNPRFNVRFVPSTGSSYANTRWGGSPGFTGDIDIAQVQLEYSSVATPFEHRSYGEELALCQRYFYATPIMGAGVYNSDSQFFCTTNPPVTFRTTPSITTKSGVFTNINIESSDLYDIYSMAVSHNPNGRNPLVSFGFPTRSAATGYGGVVAIDQNDDEFFFDAEL